MCRITAKTSKYGQMEGHGRGHNTFFAYTRAGRIPKSLIFEVLKAADMKTSQPSEILHRVVWLKLAEF